MGCIAMLGLTAVVIVPLLVVPPAVVALLPGASWRPRIPWELFAAVGLGLVIAASAVDKTVTMLLAPLPVPDWAHEVLERVVEACVTALLLSLLMTPFWAALVAALVLEAIAAVAEPFLDQLEENAV